jgi:hypothetical protein
MALRRAIKHLVCWVKVRWVRRAAVYQGLDRFGAAVAAPALASRSGA